MNDNDKDKDKNEGEYISDEKAMILFLGFISMLGYLVYFLSFNPI